jgi:hypothetical protein
MIIKSVEKFSVDNSEGGNVYISLCPLKYLFPNICWSVINYWANIIGVYIKVNAIYSIY